MSPFHILVVLLGATGVLCNRDSSKLQEAIEANTISEVTPAHTYEEPDFKCCTIVEGWLGNHNRRMGSDKKLMMDIRKKQDAITCKQHLGGWYSPYKTTCYPRLYKFSEKILTTNSKGDDLKDTPVEARVLRFQTEEKEQCAKKLYCENLEAFTPFFLHRVRELEVKVEDTSGKLADCDKSCLISRWNEAVGKYMAHGFWPDPIQFNKISYKSDGLSRAEALTGGFGGHNPRSSALKQFGGRAGRSPLAKLNQNATGVGF
jgi:hypothetical protein